MEEIWIDIPGWEGYYQVSNQQRVKSLGNNKYKKDKILKPGKDRNGYLVVTFSKNNKQKTYKLHRLIAEAFVPNPDKLPCVNHKNENKEDNSIENLEWCSVKYNNQYGTRGKRISEKLKNNPKTEEHRKKISISKRGQHLSQSGKEKLYIPVTQYTKDGEFIKNWASAKVAGDALGIQNTHITNCAKNHQNRTAGGFKWRYTS